MESLINKMNTLSISSSESIKSKRKLIILGGTDLLWIKTKDELPIEEDMIIQKEKYIYFNKDLIDKITEKLLDNPKCMLAFISSMNVTNFQPIIYKMLDETQESKKYFIFGKKEHFGNTLKLIDEGRPSEFKRNMNKIISKFNKHNLYKEKVDTTNILIIESDPSKISNNTTSNSIIVNYFKKDYFTNETEKSKITEKNKKLIEYIETYINECNIDVKEYIKNNKLNI